MTAGSNTCTRELEIEIPSDRVEKETQRITREFARVARVPGFRPGKAPPEIVRRRYWDDIRSEVLHSLIPSSLENTFREQNLVPVANPTIADLVFEPEKPLRFRATFEVLPEIKLQEYKGLRVERAQVELGEENLNRELEGLRHQTATYAPVEGRPAEKGDTVFASLVGVVQRPEEKRDPIVLEEVKVELGSENTLPAFAEGLQGVRPGEERSFEVPYPEDYPEASLRARTVSFTARVKAIKRLELPALDDDFARQAGNLETLEELKSQIRLRLEEERAEREKQLTRDRLLDALLARHDFPVPEALVERQLDRRLERQVHALLAQGIDPRRVDVDWPKLRRNQRPGALREVRLGLLLERIAAVEDIQVSEAEVEQELERLARTRGQTPEALRARLTKEGGLDRMTSGIRSEKVVELLYSNARLDEPSRS